MNPWFRDSEGAAIFTSFLNPFSLTCFPRLLLSEDPTVLPFSEFGSIPRAFCGRPLTSASQQDSGSLVLWPPVHGPALIRLQPPVYVTPAFLCWSCHCHHHGVFSLVPNRKYCKTLVDTKECWERWKPISIFQLPAYLKPICWAHSLPGGRIASAWPRKLTKPPPPSWHSSVVLVQEFEPTFIQEEKEFSF